MSELKVIDLGDIREAIENNQSVYYEYYAKSEADEVILRQKYKRCVAMAMYCHNHREIYERDSYDWELEDDAKDTLRSKAKIMRKWRQRWLKIAKQFKDGK